MATRYIKVPLFVTRQAIYTLILFFVITAILLPISIITYLNFYKMLIPTERLGVPARFLELNHLQTATINPRAVIPFLKRNSDLLFLVRLNLHSICIKEQSFHLLDYTFKLLKSYESSLIVNCDLRYIYVEKNNWIPYNLRYWVPPILVDIFKFVKVERPLVHVTGEELLRIFSFEKPVLTFKDPKLPIIIDSSKTTLDFVIEWEGIRYYLVNYFLTSFAIGVVFFWILSSAVCILSTLFFWNYFSQEVEVVGRATLPKRQKRE